MNKEEYLDQSIQVCRYCVETVEKKQKENTKFKPLSNMYLKC